MYFHPIEARLVHRVLRRSYKQGNVLVDLFNGQGARCDRLARKRDGRGGNKVEICAGVRQLGGRRRASHREELTVDERALLMNCIRDLIQNLLSLTFCEKKR